MQNSSAAVATIIIGLISGPAVRAQATESQPHFEAADVHASAPAINPYTYASGGVLRGGRYDLRKATMLDLIKTAWNVDPDTVLGGPNWLELDRFDVSAKAPPETTAETFRLMMQALLRDRFGLVLHEDQRPTPVFALTARKSKPKLSQAEGSTITGCDFRPQPAPAPLVVYECRNITMDAFAQTLRRMAPDYLVSPILNETGLEGVWDFDLKWNPRSRIPQSDASHTTIFDAIAQQLGLKLALTTAAAPVLVVDRVNEKPAPNPPGTDKLLPPRTIEFEVADLKPSRPGETPSGRTSSGRLDLHAAVLKPLLAQAFDLDLGHADELIAGLPKWTGEARFDIEAKMPSNTSGPAGNPTADDDLRMMVRNLLVERFRIKYHYEDRLVAAYSLVSAKPKMKTADPSRRSTCKRARPVENDPRDANPALNRLVACQNVTMTQFASLLLGLAPDYLATPVEDATELDGAWDFMLSFSNSLLLKAPVAGDNAAASDPNGAISLQDAISKQLGLKLEKRQRPMPILVIDHIEEKPTEN